ncbi:caspase, EACC1-associated type [Nocardia nova]|uniref:caspase, EACC1-associated type n=1 Tax=Nocardia nova TaxID=37330 RepID=UPI0018961427|nr:tetratricopeptide repeat protein [Nocardia nova]MBF6278047.1 tetratricopeptide repeat protein [Nocardia nova]
MTSTPGTEQSRAVLIGTAHYSHLQPIPAAATNIGDLAGLLTGPGGAFTAGQCVTVPDPDRDTLGTAVGRAARSAIGVLLVYYAGHGLIDRRGRLHLTVPGSDPDDIRWTTVPFETLREEILDSPARARVLILDCCFAGRAFEAMADMPGLIAGQTDLRGTYTITSSSANEPSFAPAGGRHTAFTGALLTAATALPGGTLDELYHETDRYLHRSGHPRPRRRNIDIAGQLQLFGRAADTGDSAAMSGSTVPPEDRREKDTAETRLRRFADNGDSAAMSGSTVPPEDRREKDTAETRLRRFADNGDTEAMNAMGGILEKRGEEAEAETWYRRAIAANGDVRAMDNLGLLLEKRGKRAEAETWYRRAADTGDTDAMVHLAKRLRSRGKGVEAEALFRRAADKGDRGAMSYLAAMLELREKRAKAEIVNRRAAEKVVYNRRKAR